MRLPAFIRRVGARMARAFAPKPTGQRNAWAGAFFSRLTADWIFAATRSADVELRFELRTLRNRARDLVRNSPFGLRYHQLLAENVVGPNGFALQAKNTTKDGKLFDSANDTIEDAWAEWSRADNCDVTHRLALPELLSLAVSNWGTDGELLIRILKGPQFGPFGIALQVIDVDLLDELMNQEPVGDTVPMIRQGIELNKWGAPVAYHLFTRHPTEAVATQERIRIPAEEIIHAFIPLRPGQSRGAPHAAAILQAIKMLDGYVEAEIVAARVASASFYSIEQPLAEDGGSPVPNAGASDVRMDVEPGQGIRLNPGEKMTPFAPQHPTTAFGDFTRMLAHFLAMGLGISYGTLTGDLSQANYGSMRVGMLAERDHWKRFQQFVIRHVLDRIYREWLKMALLNQQLPGLADMNVARWTKVRWQARGFDWIDPLKDVQGDLIQVAAATKTLTEVAADRGRDLEEVIEERAQEIQMLRDAGVDSVLATTITDRPDPNQAGAADVTPGTSAPAETSAPARVLPLRAARGG